MRYQLAVEAFATAEYDALISAGFTSSQPSTALAPTLVLLLSEVQDLRLWRKSASTGRFTVSRRQQPDHSLCRTTSVRNYLINLTI